MARVTVSAAKDPRATPPRLSAGAWPGSVPGLSPQEATMLAAVVRTLCPHDWLGEASYRDATLAIAIDLANDPRDLLVVREGLAALAKASAFAALAEPERVRLLAGIAGTPFFRLCLAGAIRHLYDLPEVWAGCGYDGAHGCSDARPREDFDGDAGRPQR